MRSPFTTTGTPKSSTSMNVPSFRLRLPMPRAASLAARLV
jgi:hypothetical protein